MDDEIELPPELEGGLPSGGTTEGDEGYFVPPPRGQPPPQNWVTKSRLPIDHILAGSFESAARLLHDQVSFSSIFSLPLSFSLSLSVYYI